MVCYKLKGYKKYFKTAKKFINKDESIYFTGLI